MFGVIAVTQAMLPLLHEAPAARIVNIGSAGGSLAWNSEPENPHRAMFGNYSASKSAAHALSLAFAFALESTDIKVNIACPRHTATALDAFSGARTVEQGVAEAVRLSLIDKTLPQAPSRMKMACLRGDLFLRALKKRNYDSQLPASFELAVDYLYNHALSCPQIQRIPMQILLANPRGFCAGVDRAIEIVERAIEIHGAPIYVRHEVVHNKYVVDGLREKGAIFVEELDEVPDDATVIFSAHGVSEAVEVAANDRGLQVFDATCPLVTKVHLEVVKYARAGKEVILIGHAGHPEVEGTMGRYDTKMGGRIILVESPEDVAKLDIKNPDELAFVSQTTLSVDDTQEIIDTLRQRFPSIAAPNRDDICYATQNRQDAVKKLCQEVDLLLVVGASNSSNSNRLAELGVRAGVESRLITRAVDIQSEWLTGKTKIGVTAGASAPEILVNEVVERLRSEGGETATEYEGIKETVTFSIPKALKRMNIPGNA